MKTRRRTSIARADHGFRFLLLTFTSAWILNPAISSSFSEQKDEQVIGYGYRVGSVTNDSSEKSLTAQLQLINRIAVNDTYPTYIRGMEANIFIKRNGVPYLGKVWPGFTYLLDFLNPSSETFWSNEIKIFHNIIPVDGLWMDINELPVHLPPLMIHLTGSTMQDTNVSSMSEPYQQLLCILTTSQSITFIISYGFLESRATNAALVNITGKGHLFLVDLLLWVLASTQRTGQETMLQLGMTCNAQSQAS